MRRVEVEITHSDKVLFPDHSAKKAITKGELVDYYSEVADVMLPHLKDRPLTLQRFPRGIDEKGFIQQDFADSLPDWMSRVEVAKEGGTVVHPVADRREALVWLANQNCVTPHTWLSRRSRLDCPDRLVFDLDPSVSGFSAVRVTARAVADVLDDLGLVCYVQTTGSRGLHVVVPLAADTDFDSARQFARDVADVVAADDPKHRTTEIRKDKRGDRVYLDVMRNAYAQTAVAPYGVRARPGAPVATPVEWDELDTRGMRATRFTIRDLPKRMAGRRDPWADLSRHARSLSRPRQRLSKWRAADA
jgi:bifunctional non-homologous end joining protein LigD